MKTMELPIIETPAPQAVEPVVPEGPKLTNAGLPTRPKTTTNPIAAEGIGYNENTVAEEFTKAGFPNTAPVDYAPRHASREPLKDIHELGALIQARRSTRGGINNTIASPSAIKEWSGVNLPRSQREATGEPKFVPAPERPEAQAPRRGRAATWLRGLLKLNK